jgi:MFS family permease
VAAKLLGLSWPFCLLTTLTSSYIFIKFGRRKPIFFGFLIGILGCLLVPFIAKEIYPGVYVCLILIQIGTTITSNTPLIADYVKERSMGSAIAVQGLISTIASILAISVLFHYTKSMEFTESFPIVSAILFILGSISVLLLNPKMEKSKVKEKTHSRLTYKFCMYLCFNDFVFGVCMIGCLFSEMGYLLSYLYMTGWVVQNN